MPDPDACSGGARTSSVAGFPGSASLSATVVVEALVTAAAFSLGQSMEAGVRCAAPHRKLLSTEPDRRRDSGHPLLGTRVLRADRRAEITFQPTAMLEEEEGSSHRGRETRAKQDHLAKPACVLG